MNSNTLPRNPRASLITSLHGCRDEDVLSLKDVAEILGVGPLKVGELCVAGTIPGAFRVGRLLRIQAGDLRAFIGSTKSSGGSK